MCHRQYFDPSHYRSILVDQRGAGQSTPHACLEENTTWDLVSDLERLRAHLGIEKWILFGGSWGSTLSLAYAQKHPDKCLGLILRGIFTVRREELEWFYQKGANMIYPDYYDKYKEVIPVEERGDMMAAYYKRLTGDNEEEKLKWYEHYPTQDAWIVLTCASAIAWSEWENSTCKLLVDQEHIKRGHDRKR